MPAWRKPAKRAREDDLLKRTRGLCIALDASKRSDLIAAAERLGIADRVELDAARRELERGSLTAPAIDGVDGQFLIDQGLVPKNLAS